MHSFSNNTGLFDAFRNNARRLVNQGFFTIMVAMRGREGSDGVRDSGGLEIYDIYDAVEAVKADPRLAALINPDNVHITGYSGGGGNVMSALTKFPDYFNLGSAFFGMSDYGFDPIHGWYFNGADVGGLRTPILRQDVGDPSSGDPAVLDKYHARASNLASKNNPYSEIYLFVNQTEAICPPINSQSYRDNAVAAAEYSGEFDNIHLHIGGPGIWQDFNNNGVNDRGEEQNWPHSSSLVSQAAGEGWYLARLLAGEFPKPVLNDADDLFVAGWVKTRHFELFLGDGQNAAGELRYQLSKDELRFQLNIVSNDKQVIGRLTVDPIRLNANLMDVELNGQTIARVPATSPYVYSNLKHGDTLRLIAVVPEPGTPNLSILVLISLVFWYRDRQKGVRNLFPRFPRSLLLVNG
jgi:pimeloyl-ACP methyl ester carboxylesterase